MNENENKTKRKELVKNAAIIFLTVLLILTFFSNTIMNYSLPEVSTQYVQSGNISAKIRENGVVESGDPYNVEVSADNIGRKIMGISVKVGDFVEKGDTLLVLSEPEDSSAIDDAKKALSDAQEAYEDAVLKQLRDGLNKKELQNINVTEYLQKLQNANKELDEANKKVTELDDQFNGLSGMDENDFARKERNALTDAQNATRNAQYAVDAAELNLKIASKNGTVSVGDAAYDAAAEALKKAKNVLDQAELNEKKAKTALDNKVATTGNSINDQKNNVSSELAKAKIAAKEKQKVVDELNKMLDSSDAIKPLAKAVKDAQEALNKLMGNAAETNIIADTSGTVTKINYTAGQKLDGRENNCVLTLQPEGSGYFMNISVPNDKAKKVSIGDQAELVNSWRYDDLEIVLTGIKSDPQNPGQNKILSFDVKGDVTVGQTLNISIGQKSANYDLIVPNSAIREDNNGKFILTVETKSTPLSNRYIATRTDIEVLASDDTQTAIQAALYGYEFVITTSTKPVEPGQQVRLANN